MGKDIFNGKKSMYSGMSDQRGVAYHSYQERGIAKHSDQGASRPSKGA